jgi:enoyl-CoA hydratase/carnithine racemase
MGVNGEQMSNVEGQIIWTTYGRVAICQITQPEKRNAVSLSMWHALDKGFAAAALDSSMRCIIMTGAGGHFSAGADISEFDRVRADAAAGREYDAISDRATLSIRNCPKPVIAALSGYAIGGGLGLALACDLRIADKTVRMGIPAGRLGLVYSLVDCSVLTEKVGITKAKEILFTSAIFGLEESQRLGLIDHVAESDVLSEAKAFAEQLANNAPLSLSGNKAILNAIGSGTLAAQEAVLEQLIEAAFNSQDYIEGRRAFAERRAPDFRGI